MKKLITASALLGALLSPSLAAIADETESFGDLCIRKSTELSTPDPEAFCSCLSAKVSEDGDIEADLRKAADATTNEEVREIVSDKTAEALGACAAA
jgi:hypothetical protein